MTYTEFNKKVLEHYVSRSNSSFCELSLDSHDLDNVAPNAQIASFAELQISWDGLISNIAGLPQYFGLIGIQCYAASLMEGDDQHSANAYQVRLRRLLNLQENVSLQALFQGAKYYEPIQEEIWHAAKDYLDSQYGLKIDIPSRTSYAGRFVQYPKSQALLNNEDLKHFTVFFAAEFMPGEDIPFGYFEKRLMATIQNLHITARANLLLLDESKRFRCLMQIFGFYQSWTGQVFYGIEGKKSEKVAGRQEKAAAYPKRILMVLDGSRPAFFVRNEKTHAVAADKVLFDPFIRYPATGLLFLRESPHYPDEYENTGFLYPYEKYYIVLNKGCRPKEYSYLSFRADSCITIGGDITMFEFQIPETLAGSVLNQYLQMPHPLRLLGGIRASRSNEFLQGYGPSVSGCVSFFVLSGQGKCVYSPSGSPPGLYKVRADNLPDIAFRIVAVDAHSSLVSFKPEGWNLYTYSIDPGYQVQGCAIDLPPGAEAHPVRRWIEIQLKANSKGNREERNVLLRALNLAMK